MANCKDCQNRHHMCWNDCPSYQAMKKRCEEQRKQNKLDIMKNDVQWNGYGNARKEITKKGKKKYYG